MKKIFVILITVITLAQTNRAGAQVYGSINFNTFYNELSPYGRWINDLDYGQVWIADEPGFEPYYNNGHWVYTSYGWTWVSDYRWGWAPFHYGRWTYLPAWGEWAWVPGYEWGPAWVGWCQNDGYYGWAPLGPGMGLNFTFNTIPRNYWRFVQQQYITVPTVRNHIIRPGRDQRVFQNAVLINNTQVNNNVRYEAGPQREAVERVTRRKIEPRQVDFTAADENTRVEKRAVRMYRPEMKQQAVNNTAVKPVPATQPAIAPATRPTLPVTRPDERPIVRDQRVKPLPTAPDRSVAAEQPVRKTDEPKQVTAPVQRNNEVQNLPPGVTQRPDDMRQQRIQQAQERQKQAELQRANEQQNLQPQRVQQQNELKIRQAQQEQLRQQQLQEQQQRAAQEQRQNELRQQQLEQQQARQQAMQQQKEQEQQQLRQQQLQEQRLQQQRAIQQQQNEQRQNELRQQQQERQQQRQLQQRQNDMRQQQRIQPPPTRQERITPMNQTPVRKPHGNG